TVGTDAIDGDTVAFSGGTVSAGDNVVGNARLDLGPNKVWALKFTVRVD
ncbi:MAG: hypothetical protein HKN12_00515, partial [Gemmatimonadetes bacterium]|nr:hypothetical protein [Gemmatimonadota bacterium]